MARVSDHSVSVGSRGDAGDRVERETGSLSVGGESNAPSGARTKDQFLSEMLRAMEQSKSETN